MKCTDPTLLLTHLSLPKHEHVALFCIFMKSRKLLSDGEKHIKSIRLYLPWSISAFMICSQTSCGSLSHWFTDGRWS